MDSKGCGGWAASCEEILLSPSGQGVAFCCPLEDGKLFKALKEVHGRAEKEQAMKTGLSLNPDSTTHVCCVSRGKCLRLS